MSRRANVEAMLPLSSEQLGFLLHRLDDSAGDRGIVQMQIGISGHIEFELLNKAWSQVLARHATLRTSIHWKKTAKPLQLLEKQITQSVGFEDWRGLPATEQLGNFEQALQHDSDTGFDLTQAPVSRITLFQFEDQSYKLLWSCHHIILDGWSAIIILRDFIALYEALVDGTPAELPEVASFQQFQSWSAQQNLTRQQHYWEERLAGLEHPLLFSRHLTNHVGKSASFNTITRSLSVDTTRKLEVVAEQSRVGLNTLVQSLWSLSLCHCLQRQTVVTGVLLSGRPAEFADSDVMTGQFAKCLPSVYTNPIEQTLLESLQQVQIDNATLLDNQLPGLAQLEQWCGDTSRFPVFDNIYAFQSVSQRVINARYFSVDDFSSNIISNFPLAVVVKPDEQLVFEFTHRQDVPDELIELLADTVQKLVAATLEQPQQTIAQWFNALPAPPGNVSTAQSSEGGYDEQPSDYNPPRNAQETVIAGIWEVVLGRTVDSVESGFFDSGGTSLQAMRLVGLIQQETGIELSPTVILEHPSIRTQAQLVASGGEVRQWSSLVPIKLSGDNYPLFCVHDGYASVLFYRHFATLLDANQPVFAVQPSDVDIGSSVEERAHRYVQEMLSLNSQSDHVGILGNCFGSAVAMEMAHQLAGIGKRVSLVLIDPSHPYRDAKKPWLIHLPDGQTLDTGTDSRAKRFFNQIKRVGVYETVRQKIFDRYLTHTETEHEQTNRQQADALLFAVTDYQYKQLDANITLINSGEYAELVLNGETVQQDNIQFLDKLCPGGAIDAAVVTGSPHASLFEEPHVTHLSALIQQSLVVWTDEPGSN